MTAEYKQIVGTSLELFTQQILELITDGWTLDKGYPENNITCYQAYLTRKLGDSTPKVGRPIKNK